MMFKEESFSFWLWCSQGSFGNTDVLASIQLLQCTQLSQGQVPAVWGLFGGPLGVGVARKTISYGTCTFVSTRFPQYQCLLQCPIPMVYGSQ